MFNTFLEKLINYFGTAEKAYAALGFSVALIILLSATACLVISAIINSIQNKTVSHKFKEQNEKLIQEMMRIQETNHGFKGFIDSIENLIAQSQLKYKYRFNLYYFFLFSLEFSILLGSLAYSMLGTPLLALLGIVIGAVLPFIILSILGVFMGKNIKKQVLTLIPILINNAKLKRGDVFLSIKETAKKVKAPMSYYLADFVGEFESGIDTAVCYQNLRMKVNDARFIRLVDVLEIHMNRGGNVVTSLNNLQKEFLAREIEEDRHKKESFANTIGIYLCVLSNFVIVYLMSKTMPEIITEMRSSSYEVYLLLAGINICISLIIAFKSTTVGVQKNKKGRMK